MVSKASKAHSSSDSNLHKEGKKKKIIKLHLLEVPNRRETERINKLLNFWNSWVSALPNRRGKKGTTKKKVKWLSWATKLVYTRENRLLLQSHGVLCHSHHAALFPQLNSNIKFLVQLSRDSVIPVFDIYTSPQYKGDRSPYTSTYKSVCRYMVASICKDSHYNIITHNVT